MQILKLRNADGDRSRAEETVQRFTSALFDGRIDEARRLAAPGFSWFGRTAVDWSGDAIRRFVSETRTTVSNIRPIETTMVEILPEESRNEVFGVLARDDRVLLIDLTRDDRTSTATAVVDTQRQKVVRILDAMPFKNALEILVAQHPA